MAEDSAGSAHDGPHDPDDVDGPPDPFADLDPIDDAVVDRIVAEEEAAARRMSAIEAGRRKGGVAGAAMAGAMLAISEIVEGPRRDEIVAVSESPTDPDDIDVDGISVSLDGREFWAPPPDDAGTGSSDSGDQSR